MRIGILTYHRSHNYGALLQAVALRTVLTNMGHQVSYIDYWPAYHRRMYALFSLKKSFKRHGIINSAYFKEVFLNIKLRYKRYANFNCFISRYLKPFFSSTKDTYDLIIHGSDQIWRKQPEIKTYNPVYFGKHKIKSLKRISYAASMGILPLNDNDNIVLKDLLSNLSCISVRETRLKEYVESLGFVCRLDLDPTLLLTGIEWRKQFNIQTTTSKNYILFYDLMPKSFDEQQIYEFSKKNNMEIIKILGKASKKDTDKEMTTVGPDRFLSLICDASFVFTSSFHGLVFSILFKKPFYASFAENSIRAQSLLEAIKLEDKLLVPLSSINNNYVPINYNKVDEILGRLRKTSLDYLHEQTQRS